MLNCAKKGKKATRKLEGWQKSVKVCRKEFAVMPGNRQSLRSAKLLQAPLTTRGSTYKLNSQSEYDKGGDT